LASDPQGVVHVGVVDVVADDVEVTATAGAVPSASVTKRVGSSRLLNGLILMVSLLHGTPVRRREGDIGCPGPVRRRRSRTEPSRVETSTPTHADDGSALVRSKHQISLIGGDMPSVHLVRLAWAVGAVVLLGGCVMGDPPPDPEVQPLEIVAGSSVRPDRPCILNVRSVRAGTHEVVLISESGPARIRIIDSSRRAVFQGRADSHPAKGGGFEGTEGERGSVRVVAGDYQVECSLRDKGTHITKLHVDPARPGFDEQGPE